MVKLLDQVSCCRDLRQMVAQSKESKWIQFGSGFLFLLCFLQVCHQAPRPELLLAQAALGFRYQPAEVTQL